MSFSLQVFRDELREHLGIGAEYDDAYCDRLLNRSFWDAANKFSFKEKDGLYTFNTVLGTRAYATPTQSEGVQKIFIVKDGVPNVQLVKYSIDESIQNMNDSEDSYGEPERYFRRGNEILLYPIPNDTYTINIYYEKTLGDILSDGTTLSDVWDEVILYGAISRGHAKLGNMLKSSSFSKMNQAAAAGIVPTDVKETVDNTYAQVRVLRPYPR